ncbi:MAG TPA: glycoside hydrolase family 3 N-terminal domain-containing protein [Jatrophihabitans sp.]|jgi:beta-N-acetylhexosaminidase|nr:glycoside hydrolase family 3 N-terminal domain-containing protein [Jatrophihabitans sp.]
MTYQHSFGRRVAAAVGAFVLAWGVAAAAPVPATAAGSDPAQAALAGMSLDQKIGQLFETYVYGDTATTTDPAYTAQNQALYGVDNGAELMAKYHLGGVIYFTWSGNLANPTQIANLSNGLQQAAAADGGAPLLVSTDQEGGNVVRIGAPLAVSPGNMAIGATFSAPTSFAMSHVTGAELAALGINVDDAPVVDVNTNPANSADGPRSFGDRAAPVAAMSAASVAGYQSAGVAATAKHFPGLGSTSVNTDNGVAVTDETRQQFEHNDLPPFRAAIGAGVDSIMAAHIIAPALDPSGMPASMSKPIVTGLLRGTLDYNGVVVTDALSAAALQDIPADQRAVQGLDAGDDLLLMPSDLGGSIDAVRAAVQSGEISQARLDESVLRILRLKEKLGLFDNALVDAGAAASKVGTPAQHAVAARTAQNSITLVRNNDGVLPFAAGTGNKVLVTGWGLGTTQTLATSIATHGVSTQRVYTGSNPSQATIAAAVTAAQSSDAVVVTTNGAWGDAGQQHLVQALLGTGKPVVVVALAAPYDLAYFPSAPTFVAAYGYQSDTLNALVADLFGAQPMGHLPATIRSADGSTVIASFGTGLHY